MKWSFRIATIAGTEVRIHVTFLLLLAFFAISAGPGQALESVALICAMFFCVLLHEFGHVWAAKRYGIHTPDITLLPIGGVARLERMPSKPSEELVVALCGPLVNVIIAAGLLLYTGMPTPSMLMNTIGTPTQFLLSLMGWNIMMVVFNMIPAFPMDGGRVLRALLAMIVGDYARATRWAATLGQVIAVAAGIAVIFFGFANPLLLLIAFFVFIAAGREAQMVEQQQNARDLTVLDAMMTDFRTLPPHASLREAVDLLRAGSQHDFPIVDEHGTVIGVLPRTELISGLADFGPAHQAQEVMLRSTLVLEPSGSLSDALQKLDQSGLSALPVIDPVHERLIGLFTAENAGEMMLIRNALRRRFPG
jgi:Zn-dependent protease/predicted transcriptional regulator